MTGGRPTAPAAAFPRRVLVAVGIALAAGAILFLVWQLLDALLLLFAGLLFGLFLSAVTDSIRQHVPVPRWVALTVVVVVLFGTLALVFALRGPAIADQVRELRDRIPQALERLQERVSEYEMGQRVLDEIPPAGELLTDRGTVLSRATGVVSGVMGAVTNMFVIVLFGIFVAAQPAAYVGGLLRLVSPRRRPRVDEALTEAGGAVRRWLVSKVLRMLFIGVATWIALRVLGVPVATLLAIMAALLTFVPNFGPLVAAVPAVLLALVQGPAAALWVAALYVAIQFVEGSVLDPLLTKQIVQVPPALTFGAQVLLGVLAGPIGLAVATPLTAAGVVLVRELYVRDVVEGRGRLPATGVAVGAADSA